jgi:endonuclease/exonuclease/phosphatase (EEP) superfamily protein YafD
LACQGVGVSPIAIVSIDYSVYDGLVGTELAIIGREMAAHSDPVIVAGDLNDVAWSPSTRRFRKLSNAQDPRIGRGFFNTFHAKYPLVRWPLDHVFHSKDFELVYVTRLAGYGSDHFPLYTKLQLASER